MPSYTLYNPATGEIRGQVICAASDIELNVLPGEAYIDGGYSALTYYILDGVATEKTLMSPVVSGWTISNLPIPCNVRVGGVGYDVDDGVFEFSSPLPGPYKCIISAVPYLTTEVTLP